MNQVFKQSLGRLPDRGEVAVFQKRFLGLLQKARQNDPGQFVEIAGAGALLQRLESDPQWTTALATGGWAVTARFKLESAGLQASGLPFASGDDGVSREDIIRAAVQRARRMAGVESFVKMVSLGDGVWDLKAARALNLAFIGVGKEIKLRDAGAGQTVRDFRDLATCLELMEQAPRLPGMD